MNLVVTIDTEADEWGSSSPSSQGVRNIQHLPALQALFDEYHIRPTYMVDYPVAANETSASVLKRLLDRGNCEIGSHCHPVNTPPFLEIGAGTDSMLCNIPAELQYEKLHTLHETIVKNICVAPLSFRAGRWGYGPSVAVGLAKLGYKIDTSITPFTDWSAHRGPDFSASQPCPYYFFPSDIYTPSVHGTMLEVPATIDFTWRNGFLSAGFGSLLSRLSVPPRRLRAHLTRLRLLQKTWLSPEMSTSAEMAALTKALCGTGFPLVNLFFHSSSLQPGLTPFVHTEGDKQVLLDRLREYCDFSRSIGLRPIKLSEAIAAVPRNAANRSAHASCPPWSGSKPAATALPPSPRC
jgi:hypothetical protein